jgi:ankyrin repeat protein
MTRWNTPLFVSLMLYMLLGSSHAGESLNEREKKLTDELGKSPQDPLEVQRKWEELRKGFAEAMLDLVFREPEQKVIEKLETLFQKGATVDTFNAEALEPAILHQAKRLTKLFLDKGADPNGFRSDGKPLRIATKYGDQEIIDMLLGYKAKPLSSAESAQLRLTIAAGRGDLKSIIRELSNGADVNSTDSLDYTTALIQSALFGRLEAVKLLLTRGAQPNRSGQVTAIEVFGPSGRTASDGAICAPLHAATLFGGNAEIIRVLLKAGAPVSSTNCHMSLTPLHVAAKFKSEPAVAVLLREGAKVMPKDSKGKTPLDYAEFGQLLNY